MYYTYLFECPSFNIFVCFHFASQLVERGLVNFRKKMNIWENSSFGPVKGKPLSPFISKLKLLLNDEKYFRAIHWSETGTAIVITDGETFKKLVLDRSEEMFKTRNFTSFVRQLNLYGFRKVPVSGKADPSKNMKFEHVHFKRDKPELMHLVSRTCPSRKKKKTASTSTSAKYTNKYYPRSRCSSNLSAESGADRDAYKANGPFGESPKSSPNKSGREFNHSQNSPFVLAGATAAPNKALEDYMYQKFQEERDAVQLLLSLRNPAPTPVYESLPPQAQIPFEPVRFPVYPFYPTSPPILGPYNYYWTVWQAWCSVQAS